MNDTNTLSPHLRRIRAREPAMLSRATPPDLVAACGPLEVTAPEAYQALKVTHANLQAHAESERGPEVPNVVGLIVIPSAEATSEVRAKGWPLWPRLKAHRASPFRCFPGDFIEVRAPRPLTLRVWPLIKRSQRASASGGDYSGPWPALLGDPRRIDIEVTAKSP